MTKKHTLITIEELNKIARLARIKINEEEKNYFSEQVSKILEMLNLLDEVNIGEIEPTISVTKEMLNMREDIVNDGGYPELILKNAPNSSYGCYTVPKVVDNG